MALAEETFRTQRRTSTMMTKQEHKEQLRSLLEETNEVYVVITGVSRQGTSRHMKLLAINDNKLYDITPSVWSLKVAGARRGKGPNAWNLYVSGCGMDMGFHVVDCLAKELDMFLLKRTM